MNLVARKLESLSNITHTVHGVLDGSRDTLIQVVGFAGVYRVGSSGEDDAAYMRGVVLASMASWDVACLILDFSRLDYSWGYGLLGVIEAASALSDSDSDGSMPFPAFVVVSERSREGIDSLLKSAPESSEEVVFDDLDTAITAGVRAVGEFLETTDPAALKK